MEATHVEVPTASAAPEAAAAKATFDGGGACAWRWGEKRPASFVVKVGLPGFALAFSTF